MYDIVAIHTEMVEDLYGRDMLGRITIVDKFQRTVYDQYVKPTIQVRSYRTPCSGLRREHFLHAEDIYVVQLVVQDIIKNAVVVGQTVARDLEKLKIVHPANLVQNISKLLGFRIDQKPLCFFTGKKCRMDSVEFAQVYMRVYLGVMKNSQRMSR